MPQPAVKPRIIIADDHILLVEGLRQLLGPHYDIVGVAPSGDTLLGLLRSTPADCLLLDLSLPGRSGLDLLPDVRAAAPGLRILVVTMHVDRALADVCLAAGADGFIPKACPAEELVVAISEVLAGRRFVSHHLPRHSERVTVGAWHLGLWRLTQRQQQIVKLLAGGKSNAEIAEAIGLRPSTIAFHRTQIRKALGITSEWGLLRYAILASLGQGDTGPAPGTPDAEHDRE